MVAKDSGPEGSLLFKLHWQEFAEGYLTSADAAIAIVLEEAATAIQNLWRIEDCYGAAAAIRALKEKAK
jgi:hypothetical protein